LRHPLSTRGKSLSARERWPNRGGRLLAAAKLRWSVETPTHAQWPRHSTRVSAVSAGAGRFGRPGPRWKPQMIQSSFRTSPDVENHASAGLLWHAAACGFAGQERNIVLRRSEE